MKLIDRTGKRFGRLLVIEKLPQPKKWLCRCDCGNMTTVDGANLDARTRSCGCLSREWAVKLGSTPEFVRKRAETHVVHGQKRRSGMTAEYRTWLAIKRRCYDTKYKDYPNWGGRGIGVCERWRDSFEAFFADMGPRPPGNYSIDRERSNEDYSPENCRWATALQQGETKRSNLSVERGGKRYTSLAEACKALDLPYTTIFQRIRSGLTAEQAIAIGAARPPNKRTRESYLPKSKRENQVSPLNSASSA